MVLGYGGLRAVLLNLQVVTLLEKNSSIYITAHSSNKTTVTK